MEHELFQSKLKPSVDCAIISHIMETSSSGKYPHRTAAMELILERSIQEYRKRIVAKIAMASSQPDSTPQTKGNNDAPRVPIQQVQPPGPGSQLPPQPSGFVAKYLVRNANKHEASPGSSDLSKSTKNTEVVQHEESQKNTKTAENFAELVCMDCGLKQQRSNLGSGIYCVSCPRSSSVMRCVGCGTDRAENVRKCTNCHRKFK